MSPANRLPGALVLGTALAASVPSAVAQPLTTAFTYQGELRSGGLPATGLYDLRFVLYSPAGPQVGPILCVDNLSVTEGRFTVALDFGPGAFDGQQRVLEIQVRENAAFPCGDPSGFTPLVPRQPLQSAPFASFALSAGAAANATQLNGQSASFFQNAANLNSGTLPPARLAGSYTQALTLSNPANLFTGSGAGLTGLSAANIASGALADARLSSNVALLSGAQTFAGAKTFSAAPIFSSAGSPFAVSSTALVANLNADLLDGLQSTQLARTDAANTFSGVNQFNAALSVGTAPFTSTAFSLSTALTRGAHLQSSATANGSIGLSVSALGGSGLTFGITAVNASTTNGAVAVDAHASGISGSVFGGRFRASSDRGTGIEGAVSAPAGTQTYGVVGRQRAGTGGGIL